MKGLILCGGQSTRMGTDKGLIINEARTWAQTAVDKLSSIPVAVLLSVNTQQYETYSSIFPAAMLMRDDASLNIKGPLLGVLSTSVAYPEEDLFVLACDMPLMDTSILQQLYDRYLNDRQYEAFVFVDDQQPEPLCAIYTAAGLHKIYSALQAGGLHKYSMKFALGLLPVCAIPITETQKPCFRNFNAHAAMNGL